MPWDAGGCLLPQLKGKKELGEVASGRTGIWEQPATVAVRGGWAHCCCDSGPSGHRGLNPGRGLPGQVSVFSCSPAYLAAAHCRERLTARCPPRMIGRLSAFPPCVAAAGSARARPSLRLRGGRRHPRSPGTAVCSVPTCLGRRTLECSKPGGRRGAVLGSPVSSWADFTLLGEASAAWLTSWRGEF